MNEWDLRIPFLCGKESNQLTITKEQIMKIKAIVPNKQWANALAEYLAVKGNIVSICNKGNHVTLNIIRIKK